MAEPRIFLVVDDLAVELDSNNLRLLTDVGLVERCPDCSGEITVRGVGTAGGIYHLSTTHPASLACATLLLTLLRGPKSTVSLNPHGPKGLN